MKDSGMSETSIAMAATVVLWHRNKVFLIQRHKKSGFMGSAHVFPGGRLDDEDVAAARRLDATIHHLCHQRCPMVTDPITATALCIASLRETAEESGIFVCLAADRSWLSIEQQERAQQALQSGQSFHQIITANEWHLAFEPLRPIAWWLTPPVEKKRFNTFFFGIQLNHDIRFAADPRETHGGQWWSTQAIFDAYAQQSIILAPPTYAVLEDLHQSDHFEAFVGKHAPKCLLPSN